MAAVMAGGAVAGGPVAAARSAPRRSGSLAVAAIGWGAAILGAGLAPSLPLCLAALVLVGYGSITFNATAKTALQLAARPDMRGRDRHASPGPEPTEVHQPCRRDRHASPGAEPTEAHHRGHGFR